LYEQKEKNPPKKYLKKYFRNILSVDWMLLFLPDWRYEQIRNKGHFKPKMVVFSVGNVAMNTPRYWQRRNESSTMLPTAQ
jgi:hypothetical protein